jgi:hypothetical protein
MDALDIKDKDCYHIGHIKDMIKTESLKRTEKIASAAYLITGFFDDKEPLKWKLRMLSSKLVSVSIFLKDSNALREEKTLSEIKKIILEVSALFSVAKNAGLVSDMNYEILSCELDKFLNSFSELESGFSDQNGPVLSDGFFHVPKAIESPVAPDVVKDNTYTAQEKVATEPKETQVEKTDLLPRVHEISISKERAVSLVSRTEQVKRTSIHTEPKETNLKEFGAVAVKKNGRQSVIVSLLKRKKEIMIKDVSPLIEGVSEKTIQRELLAMVKQGLLKKEGEKRWSKYSLA